MEIGREAAVRVDAVEEDVVMVTLQAENGEVFRGALLRVKNWPCPSVPPATTTLAPSSGSSLNSVLELDNDTLLSATPLSRVESGIGNSPSQLDPNNRYSASVAEREMVPSISLQETSSSSNNSNFGNHNSDFAALQHRWSYFQKNAPPLPRKNFPSKREKEKLEQVPKLRPRNFLCARCKFAMPGFTQPQVQLGLSQQQLLCPIDPVSLDATVAGNSTPAASQQQSSQSISQQQLSPSHTRKRKTPLKRTIVRPLLLPTDSTISSDSIPEGATSTPSLQSDVELIESMKHSKIASLMSQRKTAPRRSRSKHFLQHSHNHHQEDAIGGVGAPSVATILSSPVGSGDSGLKIKFKLSPCPPEKEEKVTKIKRAKKPKTTVEKKDPVEDEDEFAWPPRLRIDENPEVLPAAVDVEERAESAGLQVTVSQVDDMKVKTSILPQQQTCLLVAVPLTRDSPRKRRVSKNPVEAVQVHAPAGNKTEMKEKNESIDSGNGTSAAMPKPVARSVTQCLTKDGRTFSVVDGEHTDDEDHQLMEADVPE